MNSRLSFPHLPLRVLAAWILAQLLISGSHASTFLADGYAIRVWQTDDGLPRNMVTSAVQTRDGYLWFGTHGGLARFDGERFRVFAPPEGSDLEDRRVTRVFEDAEGTLWVGHESGVIARFREGKFERLPLRSGHIEDKVIGLGSDRDGRLWAMRDNGVFDALDGRTSLPSLIGENRPGVMSFSRGDHGDIWVSQNGGAARFTPEGLEPVVLPPSGDNDYVLCVATAREGGSWILCDERVRRWDGTSWVEDRGAFPWPDGGIACVLELRDGTLAVGTIKFGLYLIYGDHRAPVQIDRADGLPQNWVRFIHEDREGNLWAGAGSAGLASIHASAFSVLELPTETQGCSVLSVAAADDGALWLGTDGGGLYRYVGGHWDHFGPDKGLANWYVPAVAVGPQGDVWASDFWWGGPYYLAEGRFHRPAGIEETANPVYALLPLASGEWLVGNRDGLRHWKDGQATWLARSPDVSAPEVCAIAREPGGAIWCGFAHGGVARINDGQVTYFREADGLASDAIASLCVDDEGTLWIGTSDRGLNRYKDGRFTQLGVQHGLIDAALCAILDDGRGHLWLSTHHGIQRIARDALNRYADGLSAAFDGQTYDRGDGLPIVEFTSGFQAVAARTPDGRLCFASGQGLVTVDPARIQSNPIPPPVVIDSIWVDGRFEPLNTGRLSERLRPSHERIEFRFSGLSFVAPSKVQFRYRLDGIDNAWIDAGPKRTAFYSRLPAGEYRLHVIACNNDGLWNTEGASLGFVVAPFFWQTWWFVSSCSVAGLSVFAYVVRLITRRRMQQRLLELQRQSAVERERARIAQDIHDDVGSSLARIAMLSQPGTSTLAEPQRTAAMLSRIYTTAREVTRALDEIVWAVDPRHDTLDSLVAYMGKYAQDYLAAANIRCRLDAPVELPNWRITAETRHNLFLAFKEALNNVLKHAAATEVRVTLVMQAESFVLGIRDNGRGFDPVRPRAPEPGRLVSGHGLHNMQQRLASIGGTCEIASEPGQGASVSFIVGMRPHAGPLPTTPRIAPDQAASRSAR